MKALHGNFYYRKNELYCEFVPLSAIVQEVGTPTYIYSRQHFDDQVRTLRQSFGDFPHLICYAMKSNSNMSILKQLAQQDVGMDIVSGGELYRAKKAMVPADHIVFSGVGKTPEEIEQSISYGPRGILAFNIESIAEARLINQIAQAMGRTTGVAIRFNPDVDAKTHPYISTGMEKNKFGLSRKELIQLVQEISHLPGLDLRGLSVHIGSQITQLSPYRDAFKIANQTLDEIGEMIGKSLDWIDIGGGLGISYTGSSVPSIEKYGRLATQSFKNQLAKNPDFFLICEPGRIISGQAGILATQVLYKKQRPKKEFVIVDAGMNDLMRPSLYQAIHPIAPFAKATARTPLKKVEVVGPVCESADTFGSHRLPKNVDAGDYLAILSAGAYGFCMSNQYNSRPRPAEVWVDHEGFKIIRAREIYSDLIAGE